MLFFLLVFASYKCSCMRLVSKHHKMPVVRDNHILCKHYYHHRFNVGLSVQAGVMIPYWYHFSSFHDSLHLTFKLYDFLRTLWFCTTLHDSLHLSFEHYEFYELYYILSSSLFIAYFFCHIIFMCYLLPNYSFLVLRGENNYVLSFRASSHI